MTRLVPLLLTLLWPLPAAAAVLTLFGPTPYRQRSESPFYPGIQSGSIFVEDFEDRRLNTPNVSVTTGGITITQGVDEDDGVLDGLGYNYVWQSFAPVPGLEDNYLLEIKFTPDAEGHYPRYAGFAILGFNIVSDPTEVIQLYQFFGPEGDPLTPEPLETPLPRLPDGSESASSGGDRFVGAYYSEGISRIIIGNTLRFDHLQYGWSIPEPAGPALASAGLALMLLRRWR